ncbi:MAG: heavy metal translocating P-type ATPase [Enterococcus sp.]
MKIQRRIIQHKKEIMQLNGLLIVSATSLKWAFHFSEGGNILLILASIIGVLPIAIQAFQAVKVKVLSIDLLVILAVIGAFLIGEYNESAIVTFLFLFGAFLEQKTLEKTRSAVRELTQMSPLSAIVINKEGMLVQTEIDNVRIGDSVLVKAGSQVPIDGQVYGGIGYINESSITGEAKLVNKHSGDRVFAGTFLENGTLKINTEKIGEDTTFGKIIELVEEAQDTKSKAERFIDTFAKYYTPMVLILSLSVGILTQNIRLAITILVLGCPGALVIGVPVSSVAGIGNGAKNGILIKGGEILSNFSKIDTFVFDKTGTLTNGRPSVAIVNFYGERMDRSEALKLTAAVEQESDHPLGKAIVEYVSLKDTYTVTQTMVESGQGIRAKVEQYKLLIGNERLMKKHGITFAKNIMSEYRQLQQLGNSIVFVAIDGELVLLIGIMDQIKEDAEASLQRIKEIGAKQLILLTGDNQETANRVADQLPIDKAIGNLLPEGKAEYIRELQATGRKVAFIGDGINDSPSIALADIGIAMGSGTDIAIESSDVVLMQSKLSSLVHAYGLTKKSVINMKENILLALGVVLFLFIGLLVGYIYMASGMFVHEVSILVVILNGMRLLNYHVKNRRK